MQNLKQIEKHRSQNGLLSIIVPVLNNAAQLQRCIDSVVCQSLKNIELIIIDGGSADGTLAIIAQNKKSIAQSISANDTGVYAAFNKGVQLSRGEWIFFLGSDDVLQNQDVLLNVSRFIEVNWTGQKIVYGKVARMNKEGEVIEVRGEPWSSFREKPVSQWSFNHQGIFHHRSLFEEYGLFDESFEILGDHDLLLRELIDNDPLYLNDMLITENGNAGISSLPSNVKQMYWERKKIFSLHNITNEYFISPAMVAKIAIFELVRISCGLKFANKLYRRIKKT
ncbi:MAG: hypothetical protein COA36_12500 [Desulfotalea sp.]|nr:MAG: hypothetical protein COA36_12500 [Desulfotalea sp.]